MINGKTQLGQNSKEFVYAYISLALSPQLLGRMPVYIELYQNTLKVHF
jgi:hypothetical protein